MTVTDTPSAGSTSERMQALLSRAVEEQVSEQRAVSTVLAELKDQVTALEGAVRRAAANESVEQLEHSVSTVVADQRTATTLLSQRLEVLASRVEALSALATRVDAQAAALDDVERALEQFASFPEALSALQRDVSGVHDRLAPLAELRAAVGDLTARTTGSIDALRPQLEALASGAGSASAEGPDPERVRDAVVDALAIRLERLQQAAERPVVGPEVLRSGLGDVRAGVTAAVGQQIDTVQESLSELGDRVDRLVESLGEASGSSEAVGGLSAELRAVAGKVEELAALRAQLAVIAADTKALREEGSRTDGDESLDALREQLAELTARVAEVPALSVDEISSQVSVRVADRLVETLAPRIADVVLTRVSAALVTQLGEALEPQLRAQTQESVRQVTAESEARVLAHVDEGLLALAEALLRRQSLRRKPATAKSAAAAPAAESPAPSEPVHEVLERLTSEEPEEDEKPAAPERPAVTTGLAPAPVASGVAAPASAQDTAATLKKADAPGLATSQVPEEVVPAPRNGGAAKQEKPEKQAAKATKPAAKQATKPPAKPATKAAPKPKPAAKAPAKPPAKKPAAKRPAPKRPATPPAPLLERAGDNDLAPVRPTQPRPPAAAPAPPAAPPATVLPPAPPARAPEKPKRKPWWRPGG